MPLLKIVFECLYIGAFPMAVLLMLTPAGGAIFRSYVTGLIWLQSWGPLYAVLHRISMGEAAERMSAAAAMPGGDIGISLVAQAGIRAVGSDVAVMSGYLSMSVPFLAAALVGRGARPGCRSRRAPAGPDRRGGDPGTRRNGDRPDHARRGPRRPADRHEAGCSGRPRRGRGPDREALRAARHGGPARRRRLARRAAVRHGEIRHRPGRDLTFSAPKSVSIAALVGGDDRIVEAHDRAVTATLAWIEKNAAETRMKDRVTGQMARVGNQTIVAATFRHDTSRNLDPQLHSHSVIANMVQGEDGKWRSMANEGLYARQKLIGMLYRNELAGGLARLGYGIEKTHADGRFEIAGVSREAVEAFSTRRAEIEAAMAERNLGNSADNPRLAERAALMTRAAKRDIDREELRDAWRKQAAGLGLDAPALVGEAAARSVGPEMHGPETAPDWGVSPETPVTASPDAVGLDGAASDRNAASEAVAWAMAHLSEREAVFARADLFAAALAHAPGTVTMAEAEREVAALEKAGALHTVDMPGAEDSLATAKTVAEERETVSSMRAGQGRGTAPMRGWQVQEHLNKGPLTAGQKDAVKLILSAEDRVVGVQGYAGSGKTTMLDRARTLAAKKG